MEVFVTDRIDLVNGPLPSESRLLAQHCIFPTEGTVGIVGTHLWESAIQGDVRVPRQMCDRLSLK